MANGDTMELAVQCAKHAGSIVKCPNCFEWCAAYDGRANQEAIVLAFRKRDELNRGFLGMADEKVRDLVESAIQDAGDCRCRRV